MLHQCKVGYCCDPSKVKWVTITDKDGTKRTEKIFPCRHNFPYTVTGFDVEINNENGKPHFILSEKLRKYLIEKNIKQAHLSISDESQNAIAFVILETFTKASFIVSKGCT